MPPPFPVGPCQRPLFGSASTSRIHIGRYEDFIGNPPRRDTDDPEVADPLPPKDDDGRWPLL